MTDSDRIARQAQPASDAAAPAPVTITDDAGRLAVSLQCVTCGYDLRTLSREGRCPECATPVSRACRTASLQFAPPAWFKRMYRGVRLLQVSAVLVVAACGLAIAGAVGLQFDVNVLGAFVSAILAYGVAVLLLLAGAGEVAVREDLPPDVMQVEITRRIHATIFFVVASGVLSITCGLAESSAAVLLTCVGWILLLYLWFLAIDYIERFCTLSDSLKAALRNPPIIALRVAIIVSRLAFFVALVSAIKWKLPASAWLGVALFAAIACFLAAFYVTVHIAIISALHGSARELQRLAGGARNRTANGQPP